MPETVVAMKETDVGSVDVAVKSTNESVTEATVAAVAAVTAASAVSKVSSSFESTT